MKSSSKRLMGLPLLVWIGGAVALAAGAMGLWRVRAGRHPSSAGAPLAAAAPDHPTSARDVAPVLYSQCATCQRPGGGGPFNLLRCDDARKRASQIADVTATRLMPPWLSQGHGLFEGERRLTDVQIVTLSR